MDSKVLEQLYRKYERELYLYIYSICKDKHAAEDLLQETFLKAILALPDGHTNMRAWLYLVARNLTYNAIKKAGRYENMTTDPAAKKSAEPLEIILQQEQYKLLYKNLQRLSARSREILIMQYFGQLSHKEIGTVLAMTPSAVRMAAVRARKELNTHMEEEK